MKKHIIAIMVFFGLFALSGCGGGSDNISNSDSSGIGSGEASVEIHPTEMIIKDTSFNVRVSFIKKVDSSYKIELNNFSLTAENCTLSQQPVFTPDVLHLDGGINSSAVVNMSGVFDQNCTGTAYTFSATQKTTKNGQSVTEELNVRHEPENSGGGTNPASGLKFINATTPMEITQAATLYEIKVQIEKDGYVATDKIVKMKPFDRKFGSVSTYESVTGADGYAVFQYTSPETMPANGTSTTLELVHEENGTIVLQDIVLNFNTSGTVNSYRLINPSTPLVVNQENELKTISVDVVDQNGIGVNGIDVSITAVQGIQYGSIVSASTVKSDSAGHAIFTYKAPSNITVVNGNSTSVTLAMVNNGVSVTRDVSIVFDKVAEQENPPIVVISNTYKEINLTQNSQNQEIEVQVFEQGTNVPHTTGNVKVSLPNSVLEGIDVGGFSEYTVAVGSNGRAVFNYTGPQDLQTLIDSGETNATFSFYYEDNPTQKVSSTVLYSLSAGYIPADYKITTSSADGNQTMGLQNIKSFTLYLKDDQGVLVDDKDINTITITSQNILIGKLVNAQNGDNVTTLTFNESDATNSKSFTVQTFTLSGLLPIQIAVDFKDANGELQRRTIVMNVVVFSGPPTAISISYAGVEQNSTVAKYIEKFAVTVTDAYNNRVNTRPYVAVGAMVEYAVDSVIYKDTDIDCNRTLPPRTTTSPRLWHGTPDSRGMLEKIGDTNAQLTTTVNTFDCVDINNDKLVIFGAGYVYEALGKWDIASVSKQVLELKDNYYGTTRPDVGFAVGHNNRQDLCSGDQREYVGNMKANNYQLDDNGNVLVEFEYDYHLTGKDIMVWVNLTGYQADNDITGRIGEAQKHTLRGNGLVSPNSYSLAPFASARQLSFRVAHENAPEWYRNGHFEFATVGGCQVHNIIDWSNLYDARECSNTVGYVELNVSNPTPQPCTITIGRIQVSSEFTGTSSY